MNVQDALYGLVHDQPGGAVALAPRMGLAVSTLQQMANPSVSTHEWPLRRFRQAMAITGDLRPLHALAEEFGGVFVPLGDLSGRAPEDLYREVARLAAEFGDVPRAINEALADGRISQRELADIKQQVYDLEQAAAALLKACEQIAEPDRYAQAALRVAK